MLHKMKVKPFRRSFSLTRESVAAEDRTVTFSFSSDEYIDHWWGWVKLEHTKDAVDFSRMNDGAPLLFQHDAHVPIGVVEKAWIDGNKGMCTVRFSKNAKAEEVFQDVVDGIMRNVSVGFQILKLTHENPHDDKESPKYTATKWMPYEVSIVSIPADTSVGIGRAREDGKEYEIEVERQGGIKMDEDEEDTVKTGARGAQNPVDPAGVQDAIMAERQRADDITLMGRKFGQTDLAEQFVRDGKTFEDFCRAMREKQDGSKPVSTVENPSEGLSRSDVKRFNICRYISAIAGGNAREAEFEYGVVQDVSRAYGLNLKRNEAYIPYDVLSRDMTVGGVGGVGGSLIQTNVNPNYITMLKQKAYVLRLGADAIYGLVGKESFPVESGTPTAEFLGENDAVSGSDADWDDIALEPTRIASKVKVSHMLLQMQGVESEDRILRTMAEAISLAIDKAAIMGDGTGYNPTGILYTDGVEVVEIGENGGAFTFETAVDMKTKVRAQLAEMGKLAFLITPETMGYCEKTLRHDVNGSQTIWTEFAGAVPIEGMGRIASRNAIDTTHLPTNLTKGTSVSKCHAAVYGDFSAIKIGFWGGLRLLVDPYSAAGENFIILHASQYGDVKLARSASFSVCKDIVIA